MRSNANADYRAASLTIVKLRLVGIYLDFLDGSL